MVVTTLQKLIGLSVAMLGQAPGTDLLNQWTRLYTQSREDGMNAMAALQKVAQHILDSAAFAEVHPAYTIIENQEFAQRFLDQLLGETASAEVVTLVVGLLNSGTSRAEVAVRAVEYLLEVNHQGSDHADYPTFGTYAMRFGNQVEVARYYTVDKVWMTPNESVLAGVDDTAASVTAAKSDIDGMQQPGKNFTLTTGVDQFAGTPGDDIFIATEKTLTGADRVDGKQGMDKMELSGSGGNADISIPRGATVKGIETLSVSSDGKFTGDVSAWTGLETVTLEVVKDVDLELDADAGIKVTSESLGDDEDASKVTIENAGMVELEEVSKHAQVNIMGEGTTSVTVQGGKGVEVNTAASPSMTLKSVTLDGVHDGMGKDGKRYGTGENKDSVPVHIYSKAIEEITLRNTNTTLLVQNDDKDMTELTAMVDRFGNTANGYGKLCLKGIEDLMLEVAGKSNIRLASDQIKQVAVSGAGDLRLNVTRFAPAVAEKAADLKASTTLESLMLSGSGKFTMDAKGLSKLMTVDAGEATGAVEIKNLGNSVKEYTGSAGKDTVTVAAFNSKGLMADLGDGDDTFTVDNLSAGKSKIDGGAGMDTLVLKQTDGARLKGAGDAYMNFETITLEAGRGSGKYDLEGLTIDKLMVSGGAAGAITFENVMSGTDLTVSGKMPDTNGKSVSTTPILSYMLADGVSGSRFGGGDSGVFTLHVHTNGGKKDEKGDLDTLPKMSKTKLTLTVDPDVESMIVHSTATANSTVAADKRPKAGDYMNWVSISKGDNIEELKVTGDALAYVRASVTGASSPATNGLQSLRYVDARESAGGLRLLLERNNSKSVEVHGSSVNDVIATNVGSGASGDDKLLGYDGDDVLIGHYGSDMLTGGAGGDVLVGGRATWLNTNEALFRHSGTQSEADANKAVDTFIYTAASDSQVDLDKMTGFDRIDRFDQGVDKIKLSSVPGLDLRGGIKTISNSGNTKALKAVVGDGDGVFESDYSPARLDKQKHSVALVTTTEAKANFITLFWLNDNVPAISGNNITVTWVLVDYDGDGDFDAKTDMAIALIDPDSAALTAGDFI